MSKLRYTNQNLRVGWISQRAETDFFSMQIARSRFHARAIWRRVGVAIGDLVLDVIRVMNAVFWRRIFYDCRRRNIMSRHRWWKKNANMQMLVARRLIEIDHGQRDEERPQNVKRNLITWTKGINLPRTSGYRIYCSILTQPPARCLSRHPLLTNTIRSNRYQGRASSVVLWTEITRERQNRSIKTRPPTIYSARILIRNGNRIFSRLRKWISETVRLTMRKHIRLCLSMMGGARHSAWEYQTLGPFLAKNFATSVSPFVVRWSTRRFAQSFCGPEATETLDYCLRSEQKSGARNQRKFICNEKCRTKKPSRFCLRSNTKDLYWTTDKCWTHHASNGCNLQPRD